MNQNLQKIKKFFPNINEENIKITSPIDDSYNCIAFAYGRSDIKYWPDDSDMGDDCEWPNDIKRGNNMDSFINLFESIGYIICDNENFEQGYEKICIYEKDDVPKHAAKQLLNGNWSSKLGDYFDVEHSISALLDGRYGNISVFMKREIHDI